MLKTFLFALMFCFNICIAHQDFYAIKKYENVTVKITTGFRYEEINKVFIFAQLTKNLSKELNYSGDIFLDFHHVYTKLDTPHHFLSFDKAKITDLDGVNHEQELKRKAIVIRFINQKFDAKTVLKLVEYAINNKKQIKAEQKKIVYTENYWIINSIDTVKVNQLINSKTSDRVNQLLKQKVYRPEEENFKYGISYYWQNEKYHFFFRDYKNPEKMLLSLDNIFQFERFDDYNSFIFDTEKTFYYQYSSPQPTITRRHSIENIYNNYRPFKIKDIDSDIYSINFTANTKEAGVQSRQKTFLYLIRDDVFINLYKLIENKRS